MTGVPRRVLVASVRPGADGIGARLSAMVTALQSAGWEVSACALGQGDGFRAARHRLEQQGVSVATGLTQGMNDRIDAGHYGLVLLENWAAFESLSAVVGDGFRQSAVVVDAAGTCTLHAPRRSREAGGRRDHAAAATLGRRLEVYAAADAVLVETEAEAAVLAGLLGATAGIHATGPLIVANRSPLGPQERRGILFAGGADQCDMESLEFLCAGVLPRLEPELLTRHPLTVVGAAPEAVRADLRTTPGVLFAGRVPDVTPYLHRARVSVAPSLEGPDARRILGSLSACTPVVATSAAIAGTALVAGRHVVVGDDSWRVATALERLAHDDGLWVSLAEAGSALVAADHCPAAWRETLLAAIDAVTRGRNRCGTGPMERTWTLEYERLRRGFADDVEASTPAGAQVLVVSGGDDGLLDLEGRHAAHFPQDLDGVHAGAHPRDGEAAVSHLCALADRGARYLAVPGVSQYWLHSYPAFHAHLRDRCRRVRRSEYASVYELAPALPVKAHLFVAAPEGIIARLRAVPPSTCTVDLRVWDGTQPPPLDQLGGAALAVVVRPGTVLPCGFFDQLMARATQTGFDVLQPALAADAGGPPASTGQGGILGREMAVMARAPVLAARADAVPALVDALGTGDSVIDLAGLRTGVVDSPLVGMDADLASEIREVGVQRVRAVLAGPVPVPQVVEERVPAPALSVVIASYRRPELLRSCLESFVTQDLAPTDFEVVVVDDGSDDGTAEVLDSFAGRLPLVPIRIAHAGRSAAKNIGVLVAQGHLVVFFDDDDVATPSFLGAHLRAHREHPEPELAVLGHTSWAPELTVSPVMHYLTEVGMLLFSYPKLTPGQQLDFRYFWEGRVSCKRGFLLANGLHDMRLNYTIDIELGYRLSMAGLKVVYEPSARSHMARVLDFDDFRRRCEGKGSAAVAFSRLQPDPVIRDYCRIDVAVGEWPTRARLHDAEAVRVRELERDAGPDHATAPPEVLDELHRLYNRVFVGSTFKAICEAMSQPARPVLTVVIPVWSVTPELAAIAHRTVERIWEVASMETEVVVVDNGSPYPCDLRATSVVRWAENRGVAPAWNAGAAAGSGRFVAFVNSDVTVEPGWDAALCAAAAGHRVAFPWTDHCDGLGFRRPDKAGTAGWAFVLSRALLDELGPFDEDFAPAYFEDTDYWHRAWCSGVALSPVPAAHVRHARRTTARHLDGFEEIFEQNRRRYELKHGLGLDAPPPYWNREIVDFAASPDEPA